MPEPSIPEYRVHVDQLRPGVFVRLEKTDWFSHPFLYSSFKINEEQQIEAIRLLGITEVICIPEKSEVLPGQPGENKRSSPSPDNPAEIMERLWSVKKERVAQLLEKRRRIAECEVRYADSVKTLLPITQRLLSGNPEALAEALAFVRKLTDSFLGDAESILHLMNVMPATEQVYSHSLNVTVLAMMLGKAAGLSSVDMDDLGMGALFHDIGKERIEKKLLKKRGTLTRPERDAIERHVLYGVDIMSGHAAFSAASLAVVAQHHENMDGSGYPEGRADKQITRLARMTAIANAYDFLSNHPDPAQVQTPYLALSLMFSQQKTLYDRESLALFIRCLGVYPPGTVVQLSNGTIGMVMSVNPESQLYPCVVIYDPQIPKREALIVDLAEDPDLKVEKSIRLAHLPQEILGYLSPRTRMTYYVDPEA
ncbi:MAG: DUF3391 domain-containing protein [Proteobacteria bacterium]|nr:DUF3391 domain-containing protein [Pseudomonadota bacterium]MBU1611376.1 DUF3391 domain-containing protein [Pseudomonadota bacterium]